jgi:hypothetical protein
MLNARPHLAFYDRPTAVSMSSRQHSSSEEESTTKRLTSAQQSPDRVRRTRASNEPQRSAVTHTCVVYHIYTDVRYGTDERNMRSNLLRRVV